MDHNERDERPFDLELRAGDDGIRRLEGYPVIWGAISDDLGGFKETFEPGAFREALASQPDVLALINHDANRVIGRTANGTLELAEDTRGLRVSVVLPQTTYAEELYNLVRDRYLTQMSFAFRAKRGGDTWSTESGQRLRRVTNADLFDVSVVANPAYKATSVAARTLADAHEPEVNDQEVVDHSQTPDAQVRSMALLLALFENDL